MSSTVEIERIFGDSKEGARKIYNEFMVILSKEEDKHQRNVLLMRKIEERKEDIQFGIFRDMKELAFTLFNEAIKKNAVSLCVSMLSHIPETLNSRDEGGNGPQHIFANYYQKIQPARPLFELLFNEKTDLTPNKKGANPIHIAAAKIGGAGIIYASRFIKMFENIRLFDIWFVTQDKERGWTPLMYRVNTQVRSVVAFDNIPSIYEHHVIRNIKSNAGHNIFHFACIARMVSLVKKCMKFCMSSKTHPQNDKDKAGKTPLDYARGKVAEMLTNCVFTYISEENMRKTPERHIVARRAYLLGYYNEVDTCDLKAVMSSVHNIHAFQVKYPFFFDIITRKTLLDVWLSLYNSRWILMHNINKSWKIRVVNPGKRVTNTTAMHALIRSKNWKMLNYIATLVKDETLEKLELNLNVTNSIGRTPLTYMENLAFINNCYDKYPSAYTRPNVAITDIIGTDVLSYFANIAIKQILRQRFGKPDEVQKELDEALLPTLRAPLNKLEELLNKGANPAYNSNQAMVRMASFGNIDKMNILLKYGGQANSPHETISPLLCAVQNKQVETIQWLLSLDVDVNYAPGINPNAFRDVVLSPWYSTKKYDEVVGLFVQWEKRNHTKIKIFSRDTNGSSTYMLALEKMDMHEQKNLPLEERMQENALGKFIEKKKDLIHSTYNAMRWEALHTAIVRKEWTEELEATILPSYKLVFPPPQVSSLDTLLEIAVIERNYNVVERMVKYLDFDIVNTGRRQNIYEFAYDMLEMNYDTTLVDIVNLLQYHRAIKLNEKNWNLLNDEQRDALYTHWQTAIVTMDEASIREEFEDGARINDIVIFTLNGKRYCGGVLQVFLERAPLTTPQRGALKMLVDFGADVNLISEEDGLTPLMLAIEKKAINCIHILAGFPVDWKELANVVLEKPKLNVDLQDSLGVTALMMAAATGDQRLLDAVIRLNPDPNISDKPGSSVLNYAKNDVIFETLLSIPTLKIQMHTSALVEFIEAGNTCRVFKMLQRGAMIPNDMKKRGVKLTREMQGMLKRYEKAQQAQDQGPVEYLKALLNNRLFSQIKETYGEEIIKYNNVRMMGEPLIVWAYKNQFYMLVNYMLDILQRKFPELTHDLQDYLDIGTGEIIRRNQSVRLAYETNGKRTLSFKRYERTTAEALVRARRRTSEGQIPVGFVPNHSFGEKITNYLRTISTAVDEHTKTKKSSSSKNINNSPEDLLAHGKKIIDMARNNWEKRLEEFVKENPSLSNALKQYAMGKRNRAAIIAINKANPFLDIRFKF